MYCYQCGKKIAAGVRNCPYCGAVNDRKPEENSFSDRQDSSSRHTSNNRHDSSGRQTSSYHSVPTRQNTPSGQRSSSGKKHSLDRHGSSSRRIDRILALALVLCLVGIILTVTGFVLLIGRKKADHSTMTSSVSTEQKEETAESSEEKSAGSGSSEQKSEAAASSEEKSTQTSSSKSSDSGESAKPTVSANSTESANSAGSGTTANSTGSANSAGSGTSTNSTDPAGSGTTANSTESANSARSGTSANSTDPTGSGTSANSTDPAGSAASANSTDPAGSVTSAESDRAGSALTSAAVPQSGVLAVNQISASSVREYDVQYYDADYVLDGDLSTAWSEGVPGYGMGEYIELSIPAGTVITGGEVLPGFYRSEDLFYRNGAPTNLVISSGGDSCPVDVSHWSRNWKGNDSVCSFILAHSIVSNGTVRVVIGGYRTGSQYDDTMISELRLSGYAQDGSQIKSMPGIADSLSGNQKGNTASSAENTTSPASADQASYDQTSSGQASAGNIAIKTDARTDALMAYGALRAKYGTEAQMVHGLHWCLPVSGLPYEIEFMASGFSADNMPYVDDSDTVWHVGGPIRVLLSGCEGSFTPEAFAETLRGSFENVTCTMESGAGTGYYLSDSYASLTFMDETGQYWFLEIDQSSQNTITGETYAWLGIM